MTTEVITTALNQPLNFSPWWVLVPVVLGLMMVAVGVPLGESGLWGSGMFVICVGGFFTALAMVSGPTYDAELLRADMAEQLQIEETVKDGDWYTGRGPDGEFVKFTLVKQDGTEDTYSVLMDK